MALVERAQCSPVLKGMPWIAQSDSVYTAGRTHLLWGFAAMRRGPSDMAALHRRLLWGEQTPLNRKSILQRYGTMGTSPTIRGPGSIWE